MVKCILEEHNELTSPKILLRFTHPILPKLAPLNYEYVVIWDSGVNADDLGSETVPLVCHTITSQ